MSEPAAAAPVDAPATEDAPEGAGSPKPDAGAPTYALFLRSLILTSPSISVTDLIKSTRLSIVSTNAAVFPVPDCDCPIMFCGLGRTLA